MFRQHLEQNPRITDWQIRQAIDAVIIYRHQFRKNQLPEAPPPGLALDAKSTLERARQFASLKRYARSTRKTYLAWISRFLVWLKQSGIDRKPAEEDVKGFLTHLAMEKACQDTYDEAQLSDTHALERGGYPRDSGVAWT